MHAVHSVVQVMHAFGKRQVQIDNTADASIVSCYAGSNRLADVSMINRIKQSLGNSQLYQIDINDTEDSDISSIRVTLHDHP